MADYLASNFKIYQEYLKTRAAETLQQQAEVFNAATNNGIIMRTVEKPGDYEYESFFKSIASLVTRRDNTSISAASKLSMLMDEFIRVKLSRKIGPVDSTRDAFKKLFARYSEMEFSGILGGQVSNAQQIDMVNAALLALRAAIVTVNSGAALHTVSSSGTINTTGLVDGLSKFGDRADRVVCWVMHSKPYYDLVKEQIGLKITNVSNFNIQSGTPVTLNRPVLVTDSASLKITSGSPAVTDYYTLGITEGGALVEVTETNDIVVQDVTGLEQLMVRMQGEFAFNLGLKGFKWDVGNAGANPLDAALGTGAYWDIASSDLKATAGICIKSR